MIEVIQNAVRTVDSAIASVYLAIVPEGHSLMIFLFHGLFRDEREMRQDLIAPLGRTTVDTVRQLLTHYLHHGYQFVGPRQLLDGLPRPARYAMITFDDGYYNNHRVLPLLEQYNVPAMFFIATDNVLHNRCYWWDVMYRELAARGMGEPQINRQLRTVKGLRTEQIEDQLRSRFGADAFRPRGDLDRPFTPSELREFSRHPLVHLGNHTSGHAILTNYDLPEVRRQVGQAQDALATLTGRTPDSIAYPNGNYSADIVAACRDMGLRIGMTTRQHKNAVPLDGAGGQLLQLGRFQLHGQSPPLRQCRTCRCDLTVYNAFRNAYCALAGVRS